MIGWSSSSPSAAHELAFSGCRRLRTQADIRAKRRWRVTSGDLGASSSAVTSSAACRRGIDCVAPVANVCTNRFQVLTTGQIAFLLDQLPTLAVRRCAELCEPPHGIMGLRVQPQRMMTDGLQPASVTNRQLDQTTTRPHHQTRLIWKDRATARSLRMRGAPLLNHHRCACRRRSRGSSPTAPTRWNRTAM